MKGIICIFVVAMIAFVSLAIPTIDPLDDKHIASVTVGSHGAINYPYVVPIPQQPSSSPSLYPMVREIAYWVFGTIATISGIVKILEHFKKNSTQRLRIKIVR